MTPAARRGVTVAALAAVLAAASAQAQETRRSCPAPLAEARRLVLVTAASMNATAATLRLYQRDAPGRPWRAFSRPEPAVTGKAGVAWSPFFRALARRGEPIKVDGDRRAPAGVYVIGRSFGADASTRRDYLRLTRDTVCVDDPASPAYNTIASRASIGPRVHGERMSRVSLYRRGLLVDYPTDARRRAGSCIFIHVWRSPKTGTEGCVALPEPRVAALQEFAAPGAVLAILPRSALARLTGCLP
jgi:D-alanyl-D-alanine dipeptidase